MKLSVSRVGKRYGARTVLADLDLEAGPGDVIGFVGPNGCGKTTALAVIAGMVRGRGSVLFDGRQLGEFSCPAQVVGVSMLPRVFHPSRSARQHLRMIAAGIGLPESQVTATIHEVGLAVAADRAPRSFSLGMCQRLALATAIIGAPAVLVLDEPLNGLDVASVAWLVDYLRRFSAEGGIILISSHVLEPLQQIATLLIVLAEGREVTRGSVTDLRRQCLEATVRIAVPESLVARMVGALSSARVRAVVTEPGILDLSCDDPARVCAIAYEAGVPLLDLTTSTATLSDVLLSLVGSSRSVS